MSRSQQMMREEQLKLARQLQNEFRALSSRGSNKSSRDTKARAERRLGTRSNARAAFEGYTEPRLLPQSRGKPAATNQSKPSSQYSHSSAADSLTPLLSTCNRQPDGADNYGEKFGAFSLVEPRSSEHNSLEGTTTKVEQEPASVRARSDTMRSTNSTFGLASSRHAPKGFKTDYENASTFDVSIRNSTDPSSGSHVSFAVPVTDKSSDLFDQVVPSVQSIAVGADSNRDIIREDLLTGIPTRTTPYTIEEGEDLMDLDTPAEVSTCVPSHTLSAARHAAYRAA